MHVYARPRSPYWYYRFEVDGQEHRGSTGIRNTTKLKPDAAKAAQKERDRIIAEARGDTTALPEITLGEAAERWLKKAKGEEHKDYKNLPHRVRKLFGEKRDKRTKEVKRVRHGLKRDLTLHKLTQRMLSELIDARRDDEGMKQNTINQEVRLVQRIVNMHVRTHKTPAVALDFPTRKVKGKLRWLRPEEVDRLLAALDPKRDRDVGVERQGIALYAHRVKHQPEFQRELQDLYDLTVFLLDTGARYSEVATIPWSALDMKARTFSLYRSKVEGTDNAEATVAMTDRLYEVLARRYRERGNYEYVFTGKGGGVRLASGAAIRGAIRRAGINTEANIKALGGRATVHTLRDTFASWLAQTGKVTLYELQHMLGHSTPQMTQKYAHLIPNQVTRKVADVLNDLHKSRRAA